MKFNFTYGNHGKIPAHLEDIMMYTKHALTEAGHFVHFNHDLMGDSCNIVLESFCDENTELISGAVRDKDFLLVIMVSEAITGTTFNNFDQPQVAGWYSDRAMWQKRYDNFMKVAQYCRSIWCLSEEQLNGYRAVFGQDRAHLLPTGYISKYRPIEHHPDHVKDIDFLFSGTTAPRREAMLKALRGTGAHVVEVPAQTPSFIREDLISRAKICLNIKQFDGWPFPSPSRYLFHLMNKSFILAEECPIHSPIDSYITTAPSDRYGHACMDYLRDGNYTEIANRNLERFKAEMPLMPKFGEFLVKSLVKS